MRKRQNNVLAPKCNTIKAKPCNSNKETKEEQNNYQMWIQNIQEQIGKKADKWDIKERRNSSKP